MDNIILFPVARRKEAAAKSLLQPRSSAEREVREITTLIPQSGPVTPKSLY